MYFHVRKIHEHEMIRYSQSLDYCKINHKIQVANIINSSANYINLVNTLLILTCLCLKFICQYLHEHRKRTNFYFVGKNLFCFCFIIKRFHSYIRKQQER